MQTAVLLLTGATLSQFLLVVIKLLGSRSADLGAWLYSCLCLAVMVHLLREVDLLPASVWLGAIQTAVPGLFLLASAAVFIDNFKLEGKYLLPVLITILLPLAYDLSGHQGLEGVFYLAPQVLEFVLILWALWLVAASYQDDLVRARREARLWVFSLSGLIIFIRIFEQQVVRLGSESFELALLFASGLFIFCMNLALLRFESDVFAPPRLAAEQISVKAENPLLTKLQILMTEQHYFRNQSLTITALAKDLGVGAHKLRAVINGDLGHRNFNQFLNHYRIEEAKHRLHTEDSPILNIALDVGFKSLSSFNKAFKEATGLTPSDFKVSAQELNR